MLNFIAVRDHWLMRRVHRWRAPRWVRLWMICATRGGDGWLWYGLAFFVLAFGGEQRFAAVGSAGLAVGTGIGLFLWLKRVAGRKRPCHIEPHCWSTLLPPDRFSFPSGHSITAIAFALPMGLFYPPLMACLLFFAASIAVSRIILGMHFLSDVAAGSLLGALVGYSAFVLFR